MALRIAMALEQVTFLGLEALFRVLLFAIFAAFVTTDFCCRIAFFFGMGAPETAF